MKSYYYFLIPDALAWDMPKLYNKRLLTECYTNLADVKVRYQQLREQPYNYETAFDYITGCPYADSISTGVVMPVALTLLALFMILELYNATQRIAMNGSNNAFTIQQIALVMLKIVVCRWAVVHTTEILNALFEIASTVTVGISGYVGSGEVNTTVDIENAIAALPGGIGNMPVALELMVVGWMLRIVNIVVNTIVAARFIELYVYNAMASLSILHGITRPEEVMAFSYDWLLAEDSLTTKDFIAPSGYNWKPEHDDSRAVYNDRYQFGEYYGKVLYLRDIAPQMKDNLLSLLSDLDFDNVISLHIDAMDQQKAIEMVEMQLAYMQKEQGDGMSKAVRMHLPYFMGVRYELTNQIEDTKELLDKLRNYNQKIFKVCILIHTYPNHQYISMLKVLLSCDVDFVE